MRSNQDGCTNRLSKQMRNGARRNRRTMAQNRLSYDSFEPRRMLAANLELANVYLIDGNRNPITSPYIGQTVALEAVWNTTDLPSNVPTYQIGFTVDGVRLDSGLTNAGAGIPNANGYFWYRTGWFASPGTHTVEIELDVNNTVAEDNEGDNYMTFDFTSVSANLPFQLAWPMQGQPYVDYALTNFTDIDPTSGIQDYAGGAAAYNGHNAIDSGPVFFAEMDAGIPIMAAADGVVVAVNDGEYDRQTEGFNQNPLPDANFVIIDHGGGWDTFYWHLRRDSLQVQVGDSVSQGDFLGYMGSSGISTGNHIHFGLRVNGLTVEPMMDSSYWQTPIDYVFDEVYVNGGGVTNYSPTAHGSEMPSVINEWRQQPNQLTYVWANFSGLQQGDQVSYRWHQPDDSVWTTGTFTVGADYSTSWWWFSRFLPSNPDIGTWRVDFLVNGDKKGDQFFDVTADGAPEIRVEDVATNIILDNRYTPIDFGSRSQNSTDATYTFRVHNHGFQTLTTSNLSLPDNYYVVEGLSPSIAPGSFDSVTIALDTAIAGYHAGEVRFDTNDIDESEYNFSVEGSVTAIGQNSLILGISERHVDENTTFVGNLRRVGSTSAPLSVSLSSSDVDELFVPTTVTFPAGEDYVQFEFESFEDHEFDGDQIVEITATAAGYSPANNTVVVTDSTVIPVPFGVDFGPSGSTAYQDFYTSDAALAYSAETGFGWLGDVVNSNDFELQRGNGLIRDGVVLRQGTFAVDISDGTYQVDVHLGVVRKTDRIQITIEDVADEFIPNPGPNVVRSYVATVTDGQLNINLDGLPGLNNLFRVAGITIDHLGGRDFPGGKNSLQNAWQPNDRITGIESERVDQIMGQALDDDTLLELDLTEGRSLVDSQIELLDPILWELETVRGGSNPAAEQIDIESLENEIGLLLER